MENGTKMGRITRMISNRELSAGELSTSNPEELMSWKMERLADLQLKGFMADAADFSSRYSQISQEPELTGKNLVLDILHKDLEIAIGEPDNNQFAEQREV